MGNDEGLYHLARRSRDYEAYRDALNEIGVRETPDGVSLYDSGLDIEALDEAVEECLGF